MSNKKILVLLGDEPSSACSVDFAFRLLDDNGGLVVATFLPEQSKDLNHRKEIAKELSSRFENRSAKLVFRPGLGMSTEEVVIEAQFADIVILVPELMEKLMAPNAAEAAITSPIVLVPGPTKDVQHVLITHDGSKESLPRIKQFCQILSDTCKKAEVTLVEFNHDSEQFNINEEKLLIEYLRGHCANLGVFKVGEESPERILELIDFKKNTIVVSGTLDILGKSLHHIPSLTNQLIYGEKSPGFFV